MSEALLKESEWDCTHTHVLETRKKELLPKMTSRAKEKALSQQPNNIPLTHEESGREREKKPEQEKECYTVKTKRRLTNFYGF